MGQGRPDTRSARGGLPESGIGASPHPHPSPACSPQSCWVWAPVGVEALGVTNTDPEGLGQGVCCVVLRFQDPGTAGRGGACGPTPGGRDATATQSRVTACVSCQEHSSSRPDDPLPPAHPPGTCLFPEEGKKDSACPSGETQAGKAGASGAEPPGLARPPLPRGAHGLLTGRSPFADAAAGPPVLEDPSPHGSQGPQAWRALPQGSPGSRWKGRTSAPGGR